jgi:hypothetical protein
VTDFLSRPMHNPDVIPLNPRKNTYSRTIPFFQLEQPAVRASSILWIFVKFCRENL